MIASAASTRENILVRVRPGFARSAGARLDRAGLVAAVLGVMGLIYRVALVASDVPVANSDEGTAGIAAIHIAAGRDFPIYFYGQYYMGALQSYAAAPLVWAFGPSWWALRVPPLLMYAAFVLLMYRLTRRLYSPWFAVAIVGLLALGSERVIRNELIGAGGYPEMNPACALLVLLAVSLGTGARHRRRLDVATLARYAAWGFVAGLVLWIHWLALPYLMVATALLIAGCWRQLCGWAGLVVALAAVIGSAPLLRYNVHAATGLDSFSVLRAISLAGIPAPLADRLHGSIIFGLPLSTGLCSFSVCSPWQMWWGPVYVALLAVAGYQAARWLRAARSLRGGPPDGGEWIRQAGRLALVTGAALTLWAYAKSAASVHVPAESARYLHYALVSLPAVLWPLWTAATPTWVALVRWWRRTWPTGCTTVPGDDAPAPGRLALARGGIAIGVLAALVAAMVVATATVVAGVPSIAGRARDEQALIAYLNRVQVTRIYSEYWTCDRLAYVTNEKIICAVVDEKLHPGFDRYPPYRSAVAQASRVGYAFPVGDPVDIAFVDYLRGTGLTVPSALVAGYHVYMPAESIDVPSQ